ncbi:MAG: leucine-rich repeat domain-containing protein [Clostridia bacterium]|nr:leucine-rich repeat domain-containing protein [Clostridia bacterium]
MKKFCIVMALLLTLLAGCAAAETLQEGKEALKAAKTLDEQLAILNRIADEHADELENGGWDILLGVQAGPGLPEGLLPDDWEKSEFTRVDGFPAELREHKFIVLNGPTLAGSWFCRLPEQMRAASVEEAEYVMMIHDILMPSGYSYTPPATSYHRDYLAYALNIRTGEITRFWGYRCNAKRSGRRDQLNGDQLTAEEIWNLVRSQIWGQTRYEFGDDAAFLIGFSGKNAFVMGYEGTPTKVDIPSEVEGHPVTEIGKSCFAKCDSLESLTLPATIRKIEEKAFYGCPNLRSVLLPEGLESIGTEAFRFLSSLTEIEIPSSVSSIGKNAFMVCNKLSRAVIRPGVAKLGEDMFSNDENLALVYLPGEIKGLENAAIESGAVIWAPAASQTLDDAKRLGYSAVACDGGPQDMPSFRFVTEGDFEYRILDGEAALIDYLGTHVMIDVPETADGLPVTRILSSSLRQKMSVNSVTLPKSVTFISRSAIVPASGQRAFDIFIPNPACEIEEDGIKPYNTNDISYSTTLYAPEGSLAQRYANDYNQPGRLVFEAWGEGVDPDAAAIRCALPLAEKVLAGAGAVWEASDQKEYAWLSRIPGYNAQSPDAAAVLRFSKDQFETLSLLMGGDGNIARMFATIVNTQWNLPYAKVAARTVQTEQLGPVADGSCVVIALCYRTDIVLTVLREDGFAQAALVCSSPQVIKAMTPEYVSGIAAQFGISGSCTVYPPEEISALLAKE